VTEANKPIIEFRDFSFKYRSQKKPTLEHINLVIHKGEKVLIVGPSGSGKSTVARCVNGLAPFSYVGDVHGSLLIGGDPPTKLGIFGLSRLVGTVLQDTDAQFVGLTVAEDIAFAMENDSVELSVMRQRVAFCAAQVGAEHLLAHSPHELSGGQKQRVAIAGVMTGDVSILLLDEPLANLDPATGKHAIELIEELHQKTNATVIIIEHRLEDVLHRDVDRVIVVSDGMIVSDGAPDELLATSILADTGIREPLYITAMKYAGCKIEARNNPSHVETVRLDEDKKRIQSWFSAQVKTAQKPLSESILTIEHLSFSYERQNNVLTDITFDVRRGEMLSIVGKNGAGKSTLAKLICGLEQPSQGRILYQGEDMARESIKKRSEKIGMVMQNPNQMISKAMIYDEVALGLRARGVNEEEIRLRIEKTLKICGLYPFRNWPIAALSFGQKKRVTIASILALESQILILDEPTAGQDFRRYTEIMEFLRLINKEYATTIIMITHDMHLMLEYAERTLVLSDGKLIADTVPAKALTDKALIDKANLKMTSLYELALRCEIPDPTAFVERFIEYDKGARGQ